MSPGPTFDRVYLGLKEELISGRFAPGDHLEPAALGDELNASITPVRDALHRLVGERIIEAPRNNGFRVPAPTEAELRDLYGWNEALVELALRRRPRPPALASRIGSALARPDPPVAATATAAHLFLELVRRSGSPEHVAALDNLNERLGALRAAEARLFEDLDAELEALRAAFADGNLAGLRRGVAAYHRRRQRHAPELLVAARLPRDPGSQTTTK